MEPQRWKQIDRLLEEALDQEPDQRRAFLEQACPDDAELRKEVEALLEAHDKAGSFVQKPALDMATSSLPSSLIGRRLGPFQVLSLIGRGGMGKVYQARDNRLDRNIALKILPTEVASDPDRLKRFVREAKAASALNHPNIATIHEIGESDGVHWIAMELVEGQTLAGRMKDRPLKPDEILSIGVQAAEALAEAHSKGVIHRDIKPANVMLTPKGQVKILDFGLAKRIQEQGQASAVETSETHTLPGLIMGTARYMSPEQVLDQPVDHRTDIFSLGVVLYEMAAGKPPFAGETPSAIFDAVVHQPVSWPPRAQARITEELRRIINKALEKFREMRYQSAAELSADLHQVRQELDREKLPALAAGNARTIQTAESAGPRKKKWILAFAAIFGFVLICVVLLWFWRFRSPTEPETLLTPVPLTSYLGIADGSSFSPDGTQVAFAWNGEKEDNWDIYVKLIGSDPPLRLTSNPAADTWPAWSPDGRQIAFWRDRGGGRKAVVLISPLGGPERTLTEVHLREGITGGFLSWSPDGRALAMVDGKEHDPCPNLVLYMMETGEKRPLTKPPETSFGDGCPAISPDGRTLAFRRWVAWNTGDLFLLDLSQDLKPIGEPRRLTFQGLDAAVPAWVSDGSALVYSAGASLWRVAASGASQPKKLSFIGQDAYQPAISHRGSRLAYAHSRRWTGSIWRVAIPSPKGKTNPPTRLIASTRWQYLPQYSPDGTKIAFTSTRSGTAQIWVCNADGSNALQLTHFGERGAAGPDWSPDGRRLAFSLDVGGHNEVYVINANGENPRRLTFSPVSDNASWSRDGKWIYFDDPEAIKKVSPEGGQAILVAKNSPGYYGPVESPDRKFIYVTGSGTDASNYGVWRFPREGGELKQVLDWIREYRSYAVVDDGIYFIPRPDPTGGYSIQFLEMATGHVRKVAEIGKHPSMHLSVSPDRHWALYEQDEPHISELMLVENFR